MREFVRKVIEAGLLDKNTARLFELWQALPAGVAALARRMEKFEATSANLRALAQELADLAEEHMDGPPREVLLDLPTEFPRVAVIQRGKQEWELPAATFGGSVIVKVGSVAQVPRYGDWFGLHSGYRSKVNLTTLVGEDLAIVETRVPHDWA